ncbi:LLM class flavin-dependent oxidoreductase [Pseudonocardia thermophila]|jgi:Coenzyme F420-dependent N5,N10-methylene tetrahydromethanopterin reductase and related flavin-dependent oxidoreductases|uniref:LLM class flavin-dependent oxidoreductase n=1 Tax=Pseudonocardia thermophila TaxID=1848 RepID=UPI00248F07DC|nr:LLM class flavin-dependent oxidoreductase [Pseudonocardia thermophila]
MSVSLSVLDLACIPEGGTAADTLRGVVELAQVAEQAGYKRYWIAEHHLTTGLAACSPVVTMGAVAANTSHIRVGSGAVLTGHRTALSIAEDFCALSSFHPGRIDLGIGRSPGRGRAPSSDDPGAEQRTARIVGGVYLPAPFDRKRITGTARFAAARELLQQREALADPYPEQIGAILAFLADTYTVDGMPMPALPGGAQELEVWLLGSTGGESARVAGENGLAFCADYHMNPAHVLDAVAAYRAAFRPSKHRDRPYVAVSVDALVGAPEDVERAAAQRKEWLRRQRAGQGITPFPDDAAVAGHPWTVADDELLVDRIGTHLAGDVDEVVPRLQSLAALTGADELVVMTLAHDPAVRRRSYELLAKAWESG